MLLTNVLIARYTFNANSVAIVPVALLNIERTFYIYTRIIRFQVPNQRKASDKSVAIALEIAGSQSALALVDRGGVIRHRCYAKTLWGRPAIASLEPYLRAIEYLFAHAKAEGWRVRGLGVSIPGTLDQQSRRPLTIPILPSFNDFPLCDLLEARYDLPVCLHVDVDAALLGEYHYGAGKGYHRLLYLTLNAVVGAALFIDGQLERSPHASVGHISHVPLDAIQKMVQRALRRGEETSLAQRLNNREYFSPQLLAEEAVRGDAVALQVYAEVGRWLSEATARYIALFEPHALILGGSVLNASEYLFASMQSTLIMHASTSVDTPIKVVLAHLGNDAGLIGTTVPLFQNSGKLKTSVPASSLSPVSSEQ
ncbi:MAG: ROK family protein [Chloroflexi bacterium]|nr:MAG: ROK family protein [Chloroflexota bacterium]